MATEVCVLASGSKGNCTYVSDGQTRILIDAGISCRRIEELLKAKGISISSINAVLVTHEHTDHIMGLRTLDTKYGIPILANQKTATCIDIRMHINSLRWYKNNFDLGFKIGDIEVTPFRTSHDAVNSVGYSLIVGGKKVSYVTDLGYVTQGVYNIVKGSDIVILESNHDLKMLANGRYSLALQSRIKSNTGHLSNVQSAEMASALAMNGTKCIILAHLSEENNTPELAWGVCYDSLMKHGIEPGQGFYLFVASQNQPTPMITI